MSTAVTIEVVLPDDLDRFRLPAALDEQLQELLDKQDREGGLTPTEKRQAEGLVELAETLTLLRLRAERASNAASK
jgi:hypothetical protein